MPLPAALTKRTARPRLAAFLAALTVASLSAAPTASAAGLDSSLCSSDTSRVSIPSNLAVDACFDGSNLVISNPFQFPIEVHTDNGGTPVVSPTPDADLPASLLSLALPASVGLTPPNYTVSIPIGALQTTVTLSGVPQDVVRSYVWTEQLYQALGLKTVVGLGQSLAALVGELAADADHYATCLDNSSWFGDIGCTVGYDGNIAFAFGRFGVNAFSSLKYSLIFNLIKTALESNEAAGQVAAWQLRTKQFTIAAAPAVQNTPAPDPTTAAVPVPDPTMQAPPAQSDPNPNPPAQTQEPAPAPAATIGVHIEDDYYGGTWARNDPNDGTWYPHSSQPANSPYWYPNGLGVSVDCARSAASYVVRYSDGHYQNWTWWLHVTDGEWYPAAATQELTVDGNPGVPNC